MKVLVTCLLGITILSTFGCRKLGWEKDNKTTDCYCVYYFQPGLERRETFKYGGYNNKNTMIMNCLRKKAELEKKYGLGNVRCAPE